MIQSYHRIVQITLYIGLFLAVFSGPVQGAVGITPAFVELRLDKGRPAGKFVISNLGDDEERYRIKSIHFFITTDGAFGRTQNAQYSMAPWIIFNPKEITLKPKTKQTIRFAVIPRGVLKQGEYWAAMELESLKTQTSTTQDKEGRTIQIEVISTITVPIFGLVGNADYKCDIQKIDLKQGRQSTFVEAVLVNTGNGRLLVTGSYEVFSPDGKSVGKGISNTAYLLRDGNRRFLAELKEDLPAGEYTVLVRYASPQLGKNIEVKKTLTYNPPPRKEVPEETKLASSEKNETPKADEKVVDEKVEKKQPDTKETTEQN